MNMQGGVDILAANEAGDSGEVGAGDAEAVVALGVAGVGAEDGDGFVFIPEAEQGDDGIDEAFWKGDEAFDFAGAAPHAADFVVGGAFDAAVGGYLFDDGFAVAEVGDGLGVWQRGADGFGGVLDHAAVEVAGEAGVAIDLEFLDEFFGGEVAAGGVVLMEGVDGDSFGGGAGGFGEGGAESVVRFIGDADPIDCAEHDGLFGADDDDAAAAQGEFVEAFDGIVGHGGSQGGSGIDVEGGDFDGALREGEEGREKEADEEGFHGVRELTRGGEVDLRRWDWVEVGGGVAHKFSAFDLLTF